MKLFECQHCGQLLYFENVRCMRCGYTLGYLPEATLLTALDPAGDDRWHRLGGPERPVRFCDNAAHGVCNWLIPADSPDRLCRACRLNRTIPDIEVPENLTRWQRLEVAKHRLVYGLMRLHLPLSDKQEEPETGLAFDFLAEPNADMRESGPVVTGHAHGLVTIAVAEADDAERERHRQNMGEPYRTLLGHFRHEVGHYYWERLVQPDPSLLDGFRALFGDERSDYGTALARHYGNGPPPDWPDRFVSAYASSHPWEDWAETWAHYLHIVDTLETARAFGMRVDPVAGHDADLATTVDFDPYRRADVDDLMGAWVPLTCAVNSLNRSMGQPDLYPFVLREPVVDRLRFVHRVVRAGTP